MKSHPILTPAQMLDMQVDLITRLSDSNSLLREVIKTTLQYGSESSGVDKGKGEASAIAMTENLAVTAHVAEAFYITNDLAAEVVRRSRDEQYMPGIRQFTRNDAPTGAGFCYIEGGLPFRELRGRTEQAHWLIWGPVQVRERATNEQDWQAQSASAIGFWLFNDSMEPDIIAQELEADTPVAVACGRFIFQGGDVALQEQRVGPAAHTVTPERAEEIRADAAKKDRPGSLPIPETIWWTNTMRLVVALWDMLNEEISLVSHGDAKLDRAAVRRAKRMNLPGRVTVVKLRRVKYVDKDWLGHASVDWNHRWIVRRHRRWQACGPGRAERKLIWIESHIKGPESKPIVHSTKVYRLDR